MSRALAGGLLGLLLACGGASAPGPSTPEPAQGPVDAFTRARAIAEGLGEEARPRALGHLARRLIEAGREEEGAALAATLPPTHAAAAEAARALRRLRAGASGAEALAGARAPWEAHVLAIGALLDGEELDLALRLAREHAEPAEEGGWARLAAAGQLAERLLAAGRADEAAELLAPLAEGAVEGRPEAIGASEAATLLARAGRVELARAWLDRLAAQDDAPVLLGRRCALAVLADEDLEGAERCAEAIEGEARFWAYLVLLETAVARFVGEAFPEGLARTLRRWEAAAAPVPTLRPRALAALSRVDPMTARARQTSVEDPSQRADAAVLLARARAEDGACADAVAILADPEWPAHPRWSYVLATALGDVLGRCCEAPEASAEARRSALALEGDPRFEAHRDRALGAAQLACGDDEGAAERAAHMPPGWERVDLWLALAAAREGEGRAAALARARAGLSDVTEQARRARLWADLAALEPSGPRGTPPPGRRSSLCAKTHAEGPLLQKQTPYSVPLKTSPGASPRRTQLVPRKLPHSPPAGERRHQRRHWVPLAPVSMHAKPRWQSSSSAQGVPWPPVPTGPWQSVSRRPVPISS